MNLTHSPTGTRFHSVVIDCASEDADVCTKAENLVEWIRKSPAPGAIHVLFPSSKPTPLSRRVRGELLSLGCTVTIHTKLPHPRNP